MVLALPAVSFNVSVGSKAKQLDAKEDKRPEAPLQMNNTFDPVMFMMATALVLLCAAMLVYVTRS